MIRILLLEDEEPAAKRLKKLLAEIEPEAVIENGIVSVESAIQWFRENPHPDLVLSDIHLADGLSFQIFREADVKCPVIFTTAYDQYALEAFKVNSVDYLLKPLKKEDLASAIKKYKILKSASVPVPIDFTRLMSAYQNKKTTYKERFVIRFGEHIKTVETKDIAYFYTESRVNFLCTHDGKRFVIDNNLDALEGTLDPREFFRINRQFIIKIQAIQEMLTYSKSRVLVKLNPPTKLETIVSTERSADFKIWLGGEEGQ